MADKVEKKAYRRWQVLTGKHTLNNGATFKPGQKFITDANMNVFNTDPDKPKYKLLNEVTEKEFMDWVANEGAKEGGKTNLPVTQVDVDETEPEDALEAMTIADLQALAADEEIDISGAHRKAEIVEAIRTARAAADAEADE